jgi:hypothetical protein
MDKDSKCPTSGIRQFNIRDGNHLKLCKLSLPPVEAPRMRRPFVRELLARVMLLVRMGNQPLVPTVRKQPQRFSFNCRAHRSLRI